MTKKKLIFISILTLIIVLSTFAGYELITGKDKEKGKVKQEKLKDGKSTDKVKEKQKEKQKEKVTSDNIMDFDLLTGWLKDDAVNPEFNSYIYDGSSKSDFPEGSKDNVYPDINPPFLGQQKIDFRHLNFGDEKALIIKLNISKIEEIEGNWTVTLKIMRQKVKEEKIKEGTKKNMVKPNI